MIAAASDIARAKGMWRVAEDAGLGRESLYKALSREGNRECATVLRALTAPRIERRARATAEPDASSAERKRRNSRSR